MPLDCLLWKKAGGTAAKKKAWQDRTNRKERAKKAPAGICEGCGEIYNRKGMALNKGRCCICHTIITVLPHTIAGIHEEEDAEEEEPQEANHGSSRSKDNEDGSAESISEASGASQLSSEPKAKPSRVVNQRSNKEAKDRAAEKHAKELDEEYNEGLKKSITDQLYKNNDVLEQAARE